MRACMHALADRGAATHRPTLWTWPALKVIGPDGRRWHVADAATWLIAGYVYRGPLIPLAVT